MSILTTVEKQTIYRLFDISSGFIFKFWSDRGDHNKTITRDLIHEACHIDIYKDPPYRELSQQKCIEKILSECSPQVVASLLSSLLEYFDFKMDQYSWNNEDVTDYQKIEDIIKRLQSLSTISLPEYNNRDLQLIIEDIQTHFREGTPELIIDRLHTFAVSFLRDICKKHNLDVSDVHGNNYSLGTLAGKLKKWYQDENFLESEFCLIAIQNTINIFAKYNDLRNQQSAAHPNPFMKTEEAKYAVKILSDTLLFIDAMESVK